MEHFLADLVRAQSRQGDEVLVVVHEHRPGRWSTPERSEGFQLVRLPTVGQLLYTPLAPTAPLTLWRLVRRFKPQIIHLHLPNPTAFWFLILARDRPLVLHWHADVVPSRLEARINLAYRLYRPFERALLRRARRIIATSTPYLATSRPLQPFQAKARVIPLGLDPARLYQPHPAEAEALRRQLGAPLVLTVGRLTYYKGFSYLIEAMTHLPGARLRLIGRGKLKKFLHQKIKTLKLQDRVELLPGLGDRELHLHLAACEVFCLPSLERTEAFGLVLLEALAFGRPLVTTAVEGSGMNWINRHGETGLVVPPGDSLALARALGQLLEDEGLRRRLGRGARARFGQEFHIAQVARRIAALYQEALAPP